MLLEHILSLTVAAKMSQSSQLRHITGKTTGGFVHCNVISVAKASGNPAP
jgi:hypothetical protein